MSTDFARLVSLACHDLRTPLATVHGFAKTLARLEELEPEKVRRYVELISGASDELGELLDLLALAARIESGRYEPVLRDADSRELAPAGATGTGTSVRVDPEPVSRALRSLVRAAARHGGVDISVSVEGRRISIGPVVPAAAPIVVGEDPKDLGAAVAVRLLRALGAVVALEDGRMSVDLPA